MFKYLGISLKMEVNICIHPYTHSIYFFFHACHMDIWVFPANGIYVLSVIITLEQENWNLGRILLISLFSKWHFYSPPLKGVQCQLCCEADGSGKGGCDSDHLTGKLIYVILTSLQIGFIGSLQFLQNAKALCFKEAEGYFQDIFKRK